MDFEFQFLPAPPPRSTFVTALAWICIVLGSFATFISVLQNLMLLLLFPREEMSRALLAAEQIGSFEQMPPAFGFIMSHFHLFFLCFLMVSSATLILGIGLLKRRNWARLGFIALVAVGFVWNLGGLALQFTLYAAMPQLTGQQMPAEFTLMMTIMKLASVAMVTAFCVLFGWIVFKLCSAAIRTEFGR